MFNIDDDFPSNHFLRNLYTLNKGLKMTNFILFRRMYLLQHSASQDHCRAQGRVPLTEPIKTLLKYLIVLGGHSSKYWPNTTLFSFSQLITSYQFRYINQLTSSSLAGSVRSSPFSSPFIQTGSETESIFQEVMSCSILSQFCWFITLNWKTKQEELHNKVGTTLVLAQVKYL